MQLKNILFIIILILNFAVIGQTDSAKVEKHIYLKNLSNDKTSFSIKRWDEVKIWLKGIDKPVKGFVTYLNDSSLLFNETTIAIDMIEEIRITPAGGKFLGTVAVIVGGVISGAGILLMSDTKNAPGLSGFFFYLVGATATIIGGSTVIIGSAVLLSNSKKYSLNEWELQFE